MTSFVQSTRQEWFVRANLLLPHRHFVSESPMESGALFMLTIRLILPPFPLRHHSLRKMFFRTTWWDVQSICTRLSRWLLPTAHARERYSSDSGQQSERYALGVARNAARTIKCPGYVQSSCDASIQTSYRLCTDVL